MDRIKTVSVIALSSWLLLPSLVEGTNLFPDVPIIRNVSDFDFRSVAYDGSELWAVVEILPDPSSPRNEMQELYIDRHGKLLSKNFKTLRIVDGVFRRLHLLAGQSEATEWEYRLEDNAPLSSNLRGTAAERRSRPFETHGFAILQLVVDDAGATTFPRTVLIPEDWVDFVVPAAEFIRSHTLDFRDDYFLVRMLDDENPFLAVAAYRALLQKPARYHSELLFRGLSHGDKYKKGILTALQLKFAPPGEFQAIKSEFVWTVNNARRAEELVGIALGVPASLATSERGMPVRDVLDILEALRLRSDALVEDTEDSRYLELVVQLADKPWIAKYANRH